MNREKFAWVTSVVLVALLAFQLPGSLAHRDDDYAFVNTLMTVHRQVAENYVEPVDEEKLRLGAIKGMLDQLDPYTVYVPPAEEEKLVAFDFKRVRLNPIMSKERIIELRGAINAQVFLHERLGKYIQRLVAASRPYNKDTDWLTRSPSDLVERGVDLGASPRAIICWGRLVKVWTLLQRERTEVYPEDIQDLAPYVLSHRIWLGPHAASHGLTTEAVIEDIVRKVPVP